MAWPRLTWRTWVTLLAIGGLFAAAKWGLPNRRLDFNEAYEANTEVRDSQIPGAGLGLFAKTAFQPGDVVGELGGTLRVFGETPRTKGYLALIAECGRDAVKPFVVVDAAENGGHVARVNFAPSTINEVETNFQNVEMQFNCQKPLILFRATRAIREGEELFTSYGSAYNYEFMGVAAVRDFFCQRAGVDCSQRYEWMY